VLETQALEDVGVQLKVRIMVDDDGERRPA